MEESSQGTGVTCSGSDIPTSVRSCLPVALHQTVPRTDSAGSWLMLWQDLEWKRICLYE